MTKTTALASAMISITQEHGPHFANWLLNYIEEGIDNNASYVIISRYDDTEYDRDEMSDTMFSEILIDALNYLKYWDAIKGYTLTYDETVVVQIRL